MVEFEKLRAQQELARYRYEEWRTANATGKALSPEKRAEAKAHQDGCRKIDAEIGKILVDEIDVNGIIHTADEEGITIRIPKQVLADLLTCHESGLSDEEHFAIIGGTVGFDGPRESLLSFGPSLLAHVLELRKHVLPQD